MIDAAARFSRWSADWWAPVSIPAPVVEVEIDDHLGGISDPALHP